MKTNLTRPGSCATFADWQKKYGESSGAPTQSVSAYNAFAAAFSAYQETVLLWQNATRRAPATLAEALAPVQGDFDAWSGHYARSHVLTKAGLLRRANQHGKPLKPENYDTCTVYRNGLPLLTCDPYAGDEEALASVVMDALEALPEPEKAEEQEEDARYLHRCLIAVTALPWPAAASDRRPARRRRFKRRRAPGAATTPKGEGIDV